MKEKVGVAGLGIMESGFARVLLEAGFPAVVYGRTKKKTREFKSLGATVAGTPKALASQTDAVIILIRDLTALEQVTLGPDGLLQGAPRGRIFIDVSTQLPKTAHWERGLDAGKGPISRVLRCTARRAR